VAASNREAGNKGNGWGCLCVYRFVMAALRASPTGGESHEGCADVCSCPLDVWCRKRLTALQTVPPGRVDRFFVINDVIISPTNHNS
jgi:hypothetical protein